MTSPAGWICLHRVLVEKAIWKLSTPEQKTILITLLLMANHSENEWEWKGGRYVCKPGQMVTSLQSIVEQCGKGVTIQKVRTALLRFEKYGFLTNESTKHNRLITITNWEHYQGYEDKPNKATNSQLTNDQQTINNHLTTNNNDNNDNNNNNDIYSPRKKISMRMAEKEIKNWFLKESIVFTYVDKLELKTILESIDRSQGKSVDYLLAVLKSKLEEKQNQPPATVSTLKPPTRHRTATGGRNDKPKLIADYDESPAMTAEELEEARRLAARLTGGGERK